MCSDAASRVQSRCTLVRTSCVLVPRSVLPPSVYVMADLDFSGRWSEMLSPSLLTRSGIHVQSAVMAHTGKCAWTSLACIKGWTRRKMCSSIVIVSTRLKALPLLPFERVTPLLHECAIGSTIDALRSTAARRPSSSHLPASDRDSHSSRCSCSPCVPPVPSIKSAAMSWLALSTHPVGLTDHPIWLLLHHRSPRRLIRPSRAL
ncbi:hypothetical protein WOLCODRAFT_140064 [Wolfiporia cocos MD-104 SS10]|uniref:Uncharacterized protein n=1 Tax=Wolfiporia cocos (strain MD-104) TaxID=742152 RepID=A0A2H3JGC9_WOLCO|nr:hypothetical protein WOLCODRAFT_140064 [Wolfiporia cocos MD-104 SS10]